MLFIFRFSFFTFRSLLPSHVLVHLNGSILPAEQARVSPFDRGFVFGDGVYEVLRSYRAPTGRRIIAPRRHWRRMARSLSEIGIDFNVSALDALTRELLDASKLDQALIYWQVTRGTPDLSTQPARSHAPPAGLTPTLFGYARPLPTLDLNNHSPATKKCVTSEDQRWSRSDIKSIALLGAIMGTMQAQSAGADEAILIRSTPGPNGVRRLVSEGTYCNVALVLGNPDAPNGDSVVTPSLDSAPMLPGITREILCDIDPSVIQRPVLERELGEAREILLLGTTTMVTSVTHLDGRAINDGVPGPVARQLLAKLNGAINAQREDIVA
jgi:D-alanine transaminase